MRSILNLVIAIGACLQCVVVSAQVSRPRSAITLGMRGSQVREIFGDPKAYWDGGGMRYLPEQARAIPPSSAYMDVYEVSTALNTYEMRISYGSDDSESRLHPTPRVFSVHFELDKRVALNDVRKLLQDLPEAVALCGAECSIAGERETSFSRVGPKTLYLHPKSSTPAELAEAERIGSIFGKFPGRGRKPTVWVLYQPDAVNSVMVLEDDGSLEGPVQDVWKPQTSVN
jgi:hypothetical protein